MNLLSRGGVFPPSNIGGGGSPLLPMLRGLKSFFYHMNDVKKSLRQRPGLKIILLSIALLGLMLGTWFWNCLPSPLFDVPLSTVLLDLDGKLLSAVIAEDEQWRFPLIQHVPEKFVQAILCAEDKRFFHHPGVDSLAVLRAFWQNISARRVVSGASTISMQVIRLARKGQARTIKEKLIEMVLALRLELSYSKDAILRLYASYAPFGGNVVGLEAASWRYFGRAPTKLSWAETAMLAVLPKNPALVHPGNNRKKLLQKRNALLQTLSEQGIIDKLSVQLAKQEPLPPKPHPIPQFAPHLLTRIQQHEPELTVRGPITTTIRKALQLRSTEIVRRHHQRLSRSGVHNVAALILEVNSGDVLAYIGNIPDSSSHEHGNYVDIITAPRSTGSLLKPFLYAAMLDSGELLPSQLVPDLPTRMGGFAPKNYSRTYRGAVPAYMALARSLNVPAVRLLQSFSVDRFSMLLKTLGMTTLHRPAEKYGLTLILGGAEGTLWELTGIYASMARHLNNYGSRNPAQPAFFMPYYVDQDTLKAPSASKNQTFSHSPSNPFSAAACWLTFSAMLEVTRPGVEGAWQDFSSSHKIAWKTGTSYGFRDAWAIGVTPQYTVGVWVGNADGEGRPGLTGTTAAAPILFELFGLLDGYEWFQEPEADLGSVTICAQSGYLAGPNCANTKIIRSTRAGLRSKRCPYCRLIHTDTAQRWRVHSECERVAAITSKKWFVLPPAIEWYYTRNHADYHPLPPYRTDCRNLLPAAAPTAITLIYPDQNGRIYIPIELDGKRGKTVFKAAHRQSHTVIYWHLDGQYLGETKNIHQVALAPEPGKHTLTLVDENGEYIERTFTVLTK